MNNQRIITKNKVIKILLSALLLIAGLIPGFTQNSTRLIILADMGNEPDEEQQMMHMLLYSNEFNLEGLIAVTGKYLNPSHKNPEKRILHPELFQKLIEGYSKVYDNLRKHAEGYPEPAYLKSIVASGQPGYGYKDTGEGKTTPGSALIMKSIMSPDPAPLYIVVNAGSNTLAQALYDLEKKSTEKEMEDYIQKLRVYENGAQDNSGAFICNKYPGIHWIRSNYQTYCYGGPGIDGSYDNKGRSMELGPHTWDPYEYSATGQHQWALKHIIGNHGQFGIYYPLRQFGKGNLSFIEGGGTIPWLGLINKGLFSIDKPGWGSWSGRYTSEKEQNVYSKHSSVKMDEGQFEPFAMYKDAEDSWEDPETGIEYSNFFTPVWRWRRAYMNDFQCRMDWCFQSYEKANHNPVILLNGNDENKIWFHKGLPGENLKFSAKGSYDPDGDTIEYKWWIYPEAGTYKEDIQLSGKNKESVHLQIPENAKGKQIHLILEIKDKNQVASMYNYRRVVINVEEMESIQE